MAADSAGAPVHLAVTHGGRTVDLALSPTSPLADLASTLADSFDLSPDSLKLLVKGKKLPLDPPALATADRNLRQALEGLVGEGPVVAASSTTPKPIKALVVGTKRSAYDSLQAAERLRERKHAAFVHHQAHAAHARPSSSARAGVHSFATLAGGEDDPERYRFYELEPFPQSVPQFERRKAMLQRLAQDPAVRDVMRRHKFAVGVLTELHPILQPTLLGLNTNAGEKVSLRLLTNALDGVRSYADVRRVLLHELAHNRFGPHDDSFKELNSQLNKEVAAFEQRDDFEPWDPVAAAKGGDANREEAHSLNEVEAERVWDQLKFGLEDYVDERRERAGRAAEERARREKEQAGR
ncbi:hypothetical protein Rhopal_002101-T1 [Rhodotorula paludigena]|uniref:WLM domain-containing protein n=1 Tax=Rhodotorula paludigena TaxID=86838 RepID=A0AAV5GIG4_9BASI|nr:hypothetical protein Rhopal_002101-T1 [Rhodotorula paludigena]